MKFEVGDTVRILHSGEEAVVIELMEEGMVRVEVGGMDFPVFEDQLEYPYFQRFSEMRKRPEKRKKTAGTDLPIENKRNNRRKERGFFLSVLPLYDSSEEEVVSSLKLYLVNETQLEYQFYCKQYLSGGLDFEIKGGIAPFTQYYLKDLPFEDLNDRPRFEFVFVLREPIAERAPSYTYKLKLRPKQVIKKLAGLNMQQKAMFSYLIFEKYPLKEVTGREQWDLPEPKPEAGYYKYKKDSIQPKEEFRYEIDLHIEKLTDDYRHLTASDMLLLQLAALHQALERAIAHRQYSMVIIHGVGKGVLKRAVHDILKQTPEVKRFVNEYDFRYGFGATEIFFDYP